MVLETGDKQPEAIALYESSGYARIAGFGHYRGSPLSRCFGKRLRTARPRSPDGGLTFAAVATQHLAVSSVPALGRGGARVVFACLKPLAPLLAGRPYATSRCSQPAEPFHAPTPVRANARPIRSLAARVRG